MELYGRKHIFIWEINQNDIIGSSALCPGSGPAAFVSFCLVLLKRLFFIPSAARGHPSTTLYFLIIVYYEILYMSSEVPQDLFDFFKKGNIFCEFCASGLIIYLLLYQNQK